ncbi:MAG TPA: hypothetical protein VKB34_12585 [Povalibacter sp.]|nr:hypothetical protein [Povalibacter sp.]
MTISREELLQPSLSDEQPAAAPYSVRTTFLSGFFGGPFGALAISMTNSVRLRRVSRDVPLWLGLLALTLGGAWALHHAASAAGIRAWMMTNSGANIVRLVYRVAGVLIVGLGYLLHRREQRNTDLRAIERPNGWIAGLACIVLGAGAQFLFLMAIAR